MKLILAALALLALVLWSRREPDAVTEDWTHPSLDIFRRKPPLPPWREGDDGLPTVDPWLSVNRAEPRYYDNYHAWFVATFGEPVRR